VHALDFFPLEKMIQRFRANGAEDDGPGQHPGYHPTRDHPF
jgi:hypothetical protein